MRITDDILMRFEDATGIGKYSSTTEQAAAMRADIRESLAVVAPLIADQAVAGYTEMGARLNRLEILLLEIGSDQTAMASMTTEWRRRFLGEFMGRS